MEPREVYIEFMHGAWFVLYCKRKHRGRYSAATFDKSMKDRAGVVEWINQQSKLKLVEEKP